MLPLPTAQEGEVIEIKKITVALDESMARRIMY